MSNQPAPTRPWFRLTSIARPAPQPQAPSPTPAPAPAPPRPATVRPAFRPPVQAQPPPTQPQGTAAAFRPPVVGVSSVPTSPVVVGRASQPPSPSDKKPTTSTTVPVSATTFSVHSSPLKTVPTSRAKTAPITTSLTSSPTQKPAIQSPIQSPKVKPQTAPKPSPLTLPPPQLKAAQAELEPKIPVEAEQKTVVVQKMIDKPKGGLFGAPQKDLGDTRKPSIPMNGPYNNGETKEKGHGKKFSSDSEDAAGMRVITIAGENKGAFMELIRSPHKNGFQGSPHRLQKKVNSSRTGSDGNDYQSYSSSGEEGDRKMKDKSNNTSKTMPMNAFMNSNVQGVNNSIVYNSSYTHHDPGVHLSLHRKPTGGGFHVKERTNGYNS